MPIVHVVPNPFQINIIPVRVKFRVSLLYTTRIQSQQRKKKVGVQKETGGHKWKPKQKIVRFNQNHYLIDLFYVWFLRTGTLFAVTGVAGRTVTGVGCLQVDALSASVTNVICRRAIIHSFFIIIFYLFFVAQFGLKYWVIFLLFF